jgi:hypothetical protein
MIDMSEKIDLREIEKKAWITFSSKDGFYDIFIGVMLIVSAIQAFFYNIWFTSFILISVLIVPLGKKYVTIPRIGFVKFGPERVRNQFKMVMIIGIAVSATFILFLLPIFIEDPPSYLASIVMASIIAVVFAALGWFMCNYRLILYGLMWAFGEVLWRIFGEPTGPYLLLTFGIIMVFIGIFVTLRFIQNYPLPSKEVANGL